MYIKQHVRMASDFAVLALIIYVAKAIDDAMSTYGRDLC